MIRYLDAQPQDLHQIAALHARSWKLHYRGMMSDHYLDEESDRDRLEEWTRRFARPNRHMKVILAKAGDELIGFACTYLYHDPRWGSLLDNLHVVPGFQGKGIGRALFHRSAKWVVDQASDAPFYLWVFEDNTPAIGFYERLGGKNAERKQLPELPGGGRGWLYRFVWEEPGIIIS